MTDNLKLWNALCETDPKYTKKFKRPGGFEGTAQNPTYSIKKMTKQFGSVGKGWGMDKPEYENVRTDDGLVLVYCTVAVWYMDGKDKCYAYGIGGDVAVGKNKYGFYIDDEARKKAYTDAIGNALKFIGVGADIHLGTYDDNKYINHLNNKIALEDKNKNESKLAAPEVAPKVDPKKAANNYFEKVKTQLDAVKTPAELTAWEQANKEYIDRLVTYDDLAQDYSKYYSETFARVNS